MQPLMSNMYMHACVLVYGYEKGGKRVDENDESKSTTEIDVPHVVAAVSYPYTLEKRRMANCSRLTCRLKLYYYSAFAKAALDRTGKRLLYLFLFAFEVKAVLLKR
jgi:hypothetical protein